MTDDMTTVGALRDLIREFVEQRDWQQFHSPKNLSMALSIEAAELMEHFQWISIEKSREITADPEALAAVAEEIADVVSYALALVNALDLDLSQVLRAKMEKNVRKYPAAEFRGRYGRRDAGDA